MERRLIVTCEKCTTRFRIDDSRIPARGARVRCSRCKHAFFLRPPGFAERDLLDDLAGEAVDRPELPPRPPPVTEDLAPEHPAPEPTPAAAADESDWEFSEDLPGQGLEPTPLPPPLTEPREETPAPVHRDLPERQQPVARVDRAEPEALADLPWHSRPAPSIRTGPLTLVGWTTTLALALFALHGALLPERRPAPSPGIVSNGIRAQELRARWVENAFVGPLLVVSGALRAESEPVLPAGRLDVVLLDAAGDPVAGARAPFGPPLAEQQLREASPESIEAQVNEGARLLAQTPLASAATLRVEAVFPRPPAGMTRLALERGPVSRESAFPPTLPSSPE